MLDFFQTIFYNPIYNALVALVAFLPSYDIGLAIIILTILVKLALFPLSQVALRTQMAVREMEPALKELQEKFKGKQEELARRTMALYKEKGVNPFAIILLLLIQIPIVISLYFVFFNEAKTFAVNLSLLYPFTPIPQSVNTLFLGLLDVASKNIPLAIFAGVTQYWQTALTLPQEVKKKETVAPSFKDDLARSFRLQMKYVFPLIIGYISYMFGAAIALYLVTSNLFAVGQEYMLKHERERQKQAPGHG